MKKIAFLISLLVFVVGLSVLYRYGQNWDEALHFYRGQAFLNFFLTGNKNYSNLPPFKLYYQDPHTIFFSPIGINREDVSRVSMYADRLTDFQFFLKDYGHPPLSDIFASFFNYILFQRLGIINDVDSYHVYSLFLASVLAGVIFLWTAKHYGVLSGLVAFLALYLYPLFLGESRYNTKDVPETVFYSLTIIAFYEGLTKRSIRWMLISSIFFGFAWGTKFNVIFLPFIIFPWGMLYLFSFSHQLKKFSFLIPSFFIYIGIAISIFFVTWPFLWPAPIERFLDIVSYYKNIGVNSSFDPKFLTVFRVNTYASLWILYGTPLVILFFSLLGTFYVVLKGLKEKSKFSILIFLWLLLPILRVSTPNSGIYGGVRQIMEYIPAMAVLCGIGAAALRSIILSKLKFIDIQKRSFIVSMLILISFIPLGIKLASINPNESVYFNPLIGGLKGAKERNLPEWGQSLGNPNKQAIQWLDKNAEKEAKLATNFGLGSSIPTIFLRSDIKFTNAYRSVLERKGEYVIALTHQSGFEDTYFFQYLDKFLDPVYEAQVDGVPIVRVWKNDLQNTKEKYRDIVLLSHRPKVSIREDSLVIDVGEKVSLAKMIIQFKINSCLRGGTINYSVDTSVSNILDEGSVELSSDNRSWIVLDGDLRAQSFLPTTTRQENGDFVYYFAAIEARYIAINYNPQNLCFKDIGDIKIYKLKNL